MTVAATLPVLPAPRGLHTLSHCEWWLRMVSHSCLQTFDTESRDGLLGLLLRTAFPGSWEPLGPAPCVGTRATLQICRFRQDRGALREVSGNGQRQKIPWQRRLSWGTRGDGAGSQVWEGPWRESWGGRARGLPGGGDGPRAIRLDSDDHALHPGTGAWRHCTLDTGGCPPCTRQGASSHPEALRVGHESGAQGIREDSGKELLPPASSRHPARLGRKQGTPPPPPAPSTPHLSVGSSP